MRLRQLVLASGLASLLASSWANALGLGEVSLNSTLNQPLNAEIKLLDTRDLSAEQIIISLASPADFERNSVDRLYFYAEFQFQVDLEAPSGPVVRITSRNPVREPYLNFLVEARWTAGRLLREYTLLMDLPTFDDEKRSAPVSISKQTPDLGSQERQATQGRVNRQVSTDTETRDVKQSTPRVAQDGDYTVRPNDTLWDIAMAVRPDTSVSVHQAMVSLYEANPDAFINGNISRLKEGRVLRVPDTSQMTSLSKSEAATQFTQLESGMGAELSASRRTNNVVADASDISGRVTLAASNSGSAMNSGQGSGADNGRGRALESELTSTLEELDRVKSENTELTSRVHDLESQIQTMEKMVEVSNESMRALELSAEKTNQEKANQETAQTTVIDAEPSSVSESAAVSSVASIEAKPKPEVKKPEVKKPPVKPAVVPSKPATLVDQLVANAPWIGIGVVVLGGLIGFFVYRRRKQSQEPEEYDSDMSRDDIDLNFDTSMDDHETYEEPEAEEEQESFDSDADADDDVNPADKADIFIAYGQLDKAEHLLLKGLDKDPTSADIRLKLLEVYAQQQNATKFDKYYAALIPIAAPAILSRASELRSHIAEAGDFDMPDLAPDLSDEPAVKAQQAVSLDDLEMDFGDDLFLDEEKTETVAQDDDFSIELDLTEDFDTQDTQMRGGDKSAQVTEDEFALDLDFDEPKSESDELELDIDFDGEDDQEIAAQADDIDEINLALDDMDDDSDDISFASIELEKEPSLVSKSTSQDLALADDDFNLDLDSADVDLAALDDEMSSLDADFELEDTTDLEIENVSESELELSLEDDDFSFESEENVELNLDEDSGLGLAEPELEIQEETEEESISEESLFEQALSDIDDNDVALTEFDSVEDHEQDLDADDLNFLGEADEAATKLDLARAYIDMGDMTGARDILSEVVSEGTGEQQKEAKDLLSRIDA